MLHPLRWLRTTPPVLLALWVAGCVPKSCNDAVQLSDVTGRWTTSLGDGMTVNIELKADRTAFTELAVPSPLSRKMSYLAMDSKYDVEDGRITVHSWARRDGWGFADLVDPSELLGDSSLVRIDYHGDLVLTGADGTVLALSRGWAAMQRTKPAPAPTPVSEPARPQGRRTKR